MGYGDGDGMGLTIGRKVYGKSMDSDEGSASITQSTQIRSEAAGSGGGNLITGDSFHFLSPEKRAVRCV